MPNVLLVLKENESYANKCKSQHQNGIHHISEKAGHFDVGLLGNGFDHKVRGVADVCHRAKENRTGADGLQENFAVIHHPFYAGAKFTDRRIQKYQIGGCVVQKAGKCAGNPEVVPRFFNHINNKAQVPFFAGFEHGNRRDNRDENSREQLGNFHNREPVELVAFAEFPRRQFQRE